ncbi:MAG: ABC transporter substrate-binding protein [Chloroflexi bacterium]|nr:ABC transporter substrate-binding protein [Chloroflexota bacterium]
MSDYLKDAKMTRRGFLKRAAAVGLGGAVAASGLAACAPSAAPTAVPATQPPAPAATPVPAPTTAPAAAAVKVRSGFAIAPHMALQTVAASKGWFKEQGLDVEIIAFDAGAPLFEAMAAGKVDFGHTGSTPIFAIHATGTVPIYFVGTHGEATPLFKVLSRKSINSVPELKGKTGITAKGSVNHYFLLLMLTKFDMTEKDITLMHMDYADHVTAFISGNGDFISTGTNFWPQIVVEGQDAKILFEGTQLDQEPGKILQEKMVEATTVSRAFADANTEAVNKYVDVLYNRTHRYFTDPATKAQAHQELLDWLKANVNFNQPLETVTDLLNQVKYPTAAEQLKWFQDGTFAATFGSQIKFLLDNGNITKSFPFEELGNPKFVEAVAGK